MAATLDAARPTPGAARLAGAVLLAFLTLGAPAAIAADACSREEAHSMAAKRQADPADPLAGFGVWVDVPGHGTAWKPCGVAAGWRPYFHGSWSWTERGWFWVSAEPWGWLTYHYGRWLFDGAHGWVWLPGKTWAPAWVAWRWNEEVVGWAPLGPGGPGYSAAFWTFVPSARFAGAQVEAMAIPAPRIPALLLETQPPPATATAVTGSGERLSRR